MSLTVKAERSSCNFSQLRTNFETEETVFTFPEEEGTVNRDPDSLGESGGEVSLRVKVVIESVEGDETSLETPVAFPPSLIPVRSN